jgi:hypothetical protein
MIDKSSQNNLPTAPNFREEAEADYKNVYNLIKENDSDIWQKYVLYIAEIDRSDDAPHSAWLVDQLMRKYKKPELDERSVYFRWYNYTHFLVGKALEEGRIISGQKSN